MAISQTKYVQITSGQGGGAAAARKELIGRFFVDNIKIPTDTVLEFESADSVSGYFGSASDEYKYAGSYFGYVNKYQSMPGKISFYRNDTAGAKACIYGTKKPVLAALKAVTDGSMNISMGGSEYSITGLDFSSATSFADIASAVQSAIRGNTSGGTLWTAATAEYSSADNVFIFQGGDIGDIAISSASAAESGTDISGLIGWNAASAPIISQGKAACTYTELLNASFGISNNFGSFAVSGTLTTAEIAEIAAWTHGKNCQAMYSQNVSRSNASEVYEAVKDYDGTALTLDGTAGTAFIIPMAIMAATDYERVNGTVGYDFVQFPGAEVTVTTDADYETFVSMRINFYGQTQQSGKGIAFYQHGYLQGSIEDMGAYASEIWLKDAMATEFMNYMLAAPKWPANEEGLNTGAGLAIGIIQEAKTNGTIMAAKELTNVQKAYIAQLAGEPEAWRDVYSEGFRFRGSISQKTENGALKYVYTYMLIYSKGDIVRKVEGAHTLI